MNTTLTISSAGESTARTLLKNGQSISALRMVQQLLARPESNGFTAARLNRLAAECLVAQSRFIAARRHLQLAFRHDPNHAETAFQLGHRYEIDDDGDRRKAMKWFRRAVKLAPQNREYLVSFGRAAIREGFRKLGMAAVAKGIKGKLDHAELVSMAVDACRLAGRLQTGRLWLIQARFLTPHHAGLNELWNQIRFEAAVESQQPKGYESTNRIVPFLRLVGDDRLPVRQDRPSRAKPHFPRLAMNG